MTWFFFCCCCCLALWWIVLITSYPSLFLSLCWPPFPFSFPLYPFFTSFFIKSIISDSSSTLVRLSLELRASENCPHLLPLPWLTFLVLSHPTHYWRMSTHRKHSTLISLDPLLFLPRSWEAPLSEIDELPSPSFTSTRNGPTYSSFFSEEKDIHNILKGGRGRERNIVTCN